MRPIDLWVCRKNNDELDHLGILETRIVLTRQILIIIYGCKDCGKIENKCIIDWKKKKDGCIKIGILWTNRVIIIVILYAIYNYLLLYCAWRHVWTMEED